MTEATAAYDSGYTEDHGAEIDCPEMELWRAVLRQAGLDLASSDEQIRRAAVDFLLGPDLLDVMDLAGLSRAHAPWLRRRALELAEAPPEPRQPNARLITYQGQTHSLTELADSTPAQRRTSRVSSHRTSLLLK